MGHGRCSQSNIGQPFDHGGQIKAAVETVFELGKVTRYMFFANRMEGSRERGLDVAEQRIYPFERGVLRSLATTADHDRHMQTASGLDGGEARQAIGEDNRARHQTGAGIARDLALAESADTTQMQFHRPAVLRRLNGGDERGLVACAATAPAGHLTTEVGIVDLNPVAERVLPTTLQHHLHQFVLHSPGGVVFDPKVPRQLERRDALLVLGEQIDREKPFRQCQLRAMEHGPSGQRGLMVAFVTLKYLAAVQRAARGVAALGTHEALWPAQTIQNLFALFLAAVLFKKRLKTEALLELDRVFCHDGFLRIFRQFHYPGASGSVAEPLG